VSAVPQDISPSSQTCVGAASAAPVIVVGSGPVGIRFVQELRQRSPYTPVLLFGNEPWQPYNRVRLSSFLSGEASWESLTQGLELPAADELTAHLNCAIIDIDRVAHTVTDASGRLYAYRQLVLATGSRPRLPGIPGIGQANVHVFRDLNDTQRLFARRTRSQHTVVLGGGLLGLEAARAMQRFNTQVTVVEHSARLMMHQLDETASALLQARVESLGIRVLLGEGVKQVHGHGTVTGISLRDGTRLECDTLIVAIGILPNTDLAQQAGLAFGRGIRVNDQMQTSDPDIFAIGECAEHRERVYGIVAPGFEQARVAVHTICGGSASYTGSLLATRLKVLGLPVASMGRVTENDRLDLARSYTYRDESAGIYRKIVVERGRLIGAIAIGESPEASRLQEALDQQRRIAPWQLWQFRRDGTLWPEEDADNVQLWPASTVICNCNGVTRGALSEAIAAGHCTVDQIAACTRASTACGACKPLVAQLAGTPLKVEPVRAHRPLLATALGALALLLAMLLAPAIPYAQSVTQHLPWDTLWRSTFYSQLSGYFVLAVTVIGLPIALRKRWQKLSLGDFAIWRVIHVVLGLSALLGLYLHTGGRLGTQLNLILMLCFTGLAIAGVVAGSVSALEHRLSPRFVRQWRDTGIWLHILLFWPVPALLGFHIFKSYYF